jgi:hypothetical protein
VSYEDEGSISRHPELWPGIPYWWGNQVKTQALIHYLEAMKSCGRPGTRRGRGHASAMWTPRVAFSIKCKRLKSAV